MNHSTEPEHYQDGTCPCPAPHVPTRLEDDEHGEGYKATYDCPTDGAYTVWWAWRPVFYDDCGCSFCRAARGDD